MPIADVGTAPLINTPEMEQQIHQLINRERQKHGLSALTEDEQLVSIARNHSLDMASHNFFNHVNLQGEYPSDRAKRQGWVKQKHLNPTILTTGIAENIFLAHLFDKIYTTKQSGKTITKDHEWISPNWVVKTIVEGWMNSPHHRKVMLSPLYDRQGIGIVVFGYEVYVTENLF